MWILEHEKCGDQLVNQSYLCKILQVLCEFYVRFCAMFYFQLSPVLLQLWVPIMLLLSEDGEQHSNSFCVFPYCYCVWDSSVPIEPSCSEQKTNKHWQGRKLAETDKSGLTEKDMSKPRSKTCPDHLTIGQRQDYFLPNPIYQVLDLNYVILFQAQEEGSYSNSR